MAPTGHPDTITVHGTVLDGAGAPVPDALLEFWQAGPDGSLTGAPGSLRRDPVTGAVLGRNGVDFTGFGRVPTDADGHYAVRTLPATAPAGAPDAAPYLAVCVFARGLLHHLFTRVYFPGNETANAADPLLSLAAGTPGTTRSWPGPTAPPATVSMSVCRQPRTAAPRRRSSLPSDDTRRPVTPPAPKLPEPPPTWGCSRPSWAGSAAADATGDAAYLRAMLDAEAALTRAQAALGLAPRDAAAAVTEAAAARVRRRRLWRYAPAPRATRSSRSSPT